MALHHILTLIAFSPFLLSLKANFSVIIIISVVDATLYCIISTAKLRFVGHDEVFLTNRMNGRLANYFDFAEYVRDEIKQVARLRFEIGKQT